jgi:hypothetical protein
MSLIVRESVTGKDTPAIGVGVGYFIEPEGSRAHPDTT